MMKFMAGRMGDIDKDSNSRNSINVPNPLWQLCGIAREVFAELGGGEAFIRNERAQFSTSALQPYNQHRQRDDAEK
jgi:hypothetical protein